MNHGWPNLGHDSLVHAVMDASCEAIETLEEAGLRVRVLSFDVRRSGVLPEATGCPALALPRHGRAGPHRSSGERRLRILRPGRPREPRVGRAALPPARRHPRQRGRGAPRRLPHVRHPLPVVEGGRSRAARPRQGQVHRRPRERARLARRGAPVVPALRRARRARRPAARRREPSLRPHPAPRPALLGRPHRLRDARGRRIARRRGDDDRVRAGPRRGHAPDVRGEPSPRDRGPLPPGDDPEPEARPRRGDGRVVPGAARHPHPQLPRGGRATRSCTSRSDFTLLGPLRFHLFRQVRRRAESLRRCRRLPRGPGAAGRARRGGRRRHGRRELS